MKLRAIICHGTMGSPESNWFPWLASKLQARGMEVLIPCFPTPKDQDLKIWSEVFYRATGELRSSDMLIGHSVGAAFILRLLEQTSVTVRAAVLVAGFVRLLDDPEFDPLVTTFVKAPVDWTAVRQHAKRFICFSGDDDPYVPLRMGKEVAGGVNAPLQIVKAGGHLNGETGFTTFDALFEAVAAL